MSETFDFPVTQLVDTRKSNPLLEATGQKFNCAYFPNHRGALLNRVAQNFAATRTEKSHGVSLADH